MGQLDTPSPKLRVLDEFADPRYLHFRQCKFNCPFELTKPTIAEPTSGSGIVAAALVRLCIALVALGLARVNRLNQRNSTNCHKGCNVYIGEKVMSLVFVLNLLWFSYPLGSPKNARTRARSFGASIYFVWHHFDPGWSGFSEVCTGLFFVSTSVVSVTHKRTTNSKTIFGINLHWLTSFSPGLVRTCTRSHSDVGTSLNQRNSNNWRKGYNV